MLFLIGTFKFKQIVVLWRLSLFIRFLWGINFLDLVQAEHVFSSIINARSKKPKDGQAYVRFRNP
jgi:hypothetical protein